MAILQVSAPTAVGAWRGPAGQTDPATIRQLVMRPAGFDASILDVQPRQIDASVGLWSEAPAPGDLDGPNEPMGAGWLTHFEHDGTSKAGMGGHTSNAAVTVVSDLDAPMGQAIQFGMPVGYDTGYSSDFTASTPALREIYCYARRKWDPSYMVHSGGDKLWHIGHNGSIHTAYFVQIRSSTDPRWFGFQNNHAWGDSPMGFRLNPYGNWDVGHPVIYFDNQYHDIEWYQRAQSAPGVADGVFTFWYDGEVVAHRTDMSYVRAGYNVQFRQVNYRYYRGGSGGVPLTQASWVRDAIFRIKGLA